MPYDEQGNWIPTQSQTANLPALRPSDQMVEAYSTPYVPSFSEDERAAAFEELLQRAAPILWTLHQFDRPRNAAASAVYRGLYGKPGEDAGFWSGLKEGALQSGPDISWGDVLGIKPPSGDMTWPGWLARAGARLGLDIAGDPLTYAFAPASAATKLGRGVKAVAPFLKEGQSLGGKALEVSRIPQIAENLSLKSGLNKAFGHEPATETAVAALDASRRRSNVANQLTQEQVEEAIKAAEEMGVTPEKMVDLFHAVERPMEEVPGITREARKLADPLLERRGQTFEQLNQAREAMGLEKIPDISGPEYTQMYHRFFGKGPQDKAAAELGRMREWFTGRPEGRELMRMVKEGTDEDVIPGLVSSLNPKYLAPLGLKQDRKTGQWIYTERGGTANKPRKPIEEGQYMGLDELDELTKQADRYPNRPENWAYGTIPGKKTIVEPTTQVSLKEILEAPNLSMDPHMVETNPFRALEAQMGKQQGELGFREAVQEMIGTGDLKRIEAPMPAPKGRFAEGEIVSTREGQYGVVGNSNKKTTFLDIDGEMHEFPNELLKSLHKTASRLPWEEPESIGSQVWNFLKELPQEPKPRQPRVRGLEEFETHPKTADWLENMAAGSDPTARSAAERLFSLINSTGWGEANKNFSNMWKSTVLGLHGGFHTGNVGSSVQMQYLKGMDAAGILPRAYQTARQQLGRGQDLLPGFDLAQEAKIRNVAGSGFFGGQSADIAATEGRGWINKLGQYPPFKQIGAAQDWGARQGGYLEDNAKMGLFIDYVLKNAPENLATLPPEVQARFFDKAGQFAHSGMIDYGPGGGWTGLERELLPWLPFYKWGRGITGVTADTAINRPQRLARLDRFFNQIFEGSDLDDRRAMPEYMKEQSPIQGAFGHTFEPNEAGERRLALIGRYLAQGNIEQMLSRPLDYVASMVGPAAKIIGEPIANYSVFKDRPIDEVTGFPGNLVNPLIGGKYADANRQIAGQTLPAGWDDLVSKLPGGRYLNEANELGRALGLWSDQYRKTEPTLPEWLMWWLAGGKTFPFDRERALKQRGREADKQISAIKHDIRMGRRAKDEGRIEKGLRLLEEAQGGKRQLLGR